MIYTDFYRPTFTIVVGPPGSGKSRRAKELVEVEEFTKVFSSDEIREELTGDANCQSVNEEVFKLMKERTLQAINDGYSVIYDATNVTRKSRASILELIPKYVHKRCIICWAPIDVCIERDSLRERTVGKAVIDKMLTRFEAPFYDEGFDEITVYIDGIHYNPEHYELQMYEAMKIPHDNPHHTLDIYDHCNRCGGSLTTRGDTPHFVAYAGFMHDVGKPYVKAFKDRNGNDTDIAHYYGHQGVGAWMIYGIDDKTESMVTIAWLVSTHMAPFINLKYYNSLPPMYKKWIDLLHNADVEAH